MNCFSQKLFKNLPGKLFIDSLSIKKISRMGILNYK